MDQSRLHRFALRALLASLAMLAAAAAGAGADSGGANFDTQGPDAGATQLATWYGPGFFGEETACGKTLTRRTIGVAHRKLPCGTRVEFNYKGESLRTTVIDRGPYGTRARWDLTQRAAQILGLEQTDEVRVETLEKRARRR